MGFVYFTLPVVVGYFVMQYTISISEKNNNKLLQKTESSLETKLQNMRLNEMLKDIKNQNSKT